MRLRARRIEPELTTEFVFGLNASPSRPTCLPSTEPMALLIFLIMRAQNSWFTSRAAVRILSDTPEQSARLAKESMSDSVKLPPSDPGCNDRGAIRLSNPSARERSTASALMRSHKLESSLIKETLV